ncbi:MAG: vWA domain-containing protein [Ilumatobacteraceae bacterium]|nr:VWA domain-containing protein [Actinomycetota bacterium]MDA3011583.1 VWA domain-containing protein [Actinomycetota bacterium]MDA3024888.1 VWA domain-containing protein [Actinomycetota bacterium]
MSTSTASLDHASPEQIAVGFCRVLRGVGLPTPLGSVLLFVEALGRTGVESRDSVYWSARATLVRRPEDFSLFDRAFSVFWTQRHELEPTDDEIQHVTLLVDTDGDEGSDDKGEADSLDDDSIALRFSAVETLRHKDFARYTPSELSEAQDLMSRLRLAGSPRESFRFVKGSSSRPDLRRTVRASLATGGEPIRRHWLEPDQRLRRLVLLLDVSGSMEPYSRALVRFVQAAVAGRQKVEAFAIGTRLTRVTRELSHRDPDRALARAAERVADWSGGTRLGDSLRRFNDEWGVRGMARGAIVVILSDGWDRGDTDVLAAEMQRLHRVSFRTIWVNPLKVTPGYAPLARGMAAALPHVDHFVEGHSIDAMERLARVVSAP